ncbi:hypothetical protein F53441_11711 [Fusarium austroafricanum]|uniref:Putative gamma-glutamylcyclotransferase n=1 Tax=Fusarium austroafricanum TaxID=2364996 RepID=A0A8H4K2G1_9HYPO|nr:hypothetical protein F53441_11711 [Fusarium austroafricanum]
MFILAFHRTSVPRAKMALMQSVKSALGVPIRKSSAPILPLHNSKKHTPVRNAQPFRQVPLQDILPHDPHFSARQQIQAIDTDIRAIQEDLVYIGARLNALKDDTSENDIKRQLREMLCASSETMFVLRDLRRRLESKARKTRAVTQYCRFHNAFSIIKAMDILDILEAMAQATTTMDKAEVDEPAIRRWQSLFGYSSSDARQRIEEYRCSQPQIVVSDDHWNMVREKMVSQGFDREAYQYSCNTRKHSTSPRQELTKRQKRKLRASIFLVKLEGPLNTVGAVTQARGLPSDGGEVVFATDASGEASTFYEINGIDKMAIEGYLRASPYHSGFTSTFIRCMQARKNLSASSLYPTLGIDSTMPQHRVGSLDNVPRPAQNECPVWYFFYGTLADPVVLSKMLGFQPHYREAKIRGGLLKSWGQYKALVDDPDGGNEVMGKAFLVVSKEEEDSLRIYETDAYEVVRCLIEMEGGDMVNGLTFRFIEEAMD